VLLTNLTIEAVAGVIGLVFVTIGLRGRRTGSEPRCKSCEYNLTCLTSDRCPECGNPVTPPNVVRGLRRKRPISLCVGAVLLALAMTALIERARRTNWYPHLPFRVLLILGQRDDPMALLELRYRFNGEHGLSDSQLRMLATACLDIHRSGVRPREYRQWMQLLAVIGSANKLTESEQARLFRQISPDLSVAWRPRVRKGRPIPLQIAVTQAKTMPTMRTRVDDWRIVSRDRQISAAAQGPPVTFPANLSSPRTQVVPVQIDVAPGVYHAEFVATLRLLGWKRGEADEIWSKKYRIPLTIEVFPAGGDDDLVIHAGPAVDQQLHRALFRAGSYWSWAVEAAGVERRTPYWVDIPLNNPLPFGAALDVILDDGISEQFVGLILFVKGAPLAHARLNLPDAALSAYFDRPNVRLVLRSDLDLVRNTIDIVEPFDGEIRFPLADAPIPFRTHPDRHAVTLGPLRRDR